jgi:hypothetical protein
MLIKTTLKPPKQKENFSDAKQQTIYQKKKFYRKIMM